IEILQAAHTQSHPLFQVLLVLQNVPMPNVEMAGLDVREFDLDSGTTNFDLTISLTETPEGLTGRIEYATDLFDPERIERMAGHFQMLIEDVCENPGGRLSQLSLMTAAERSQLLVEWNRVEADPTDCCIYEMFQRQAQSTPQGIAIRFQDEQWSYARLDARSSRIAERLRSHGVEPGALVGVWMDPSPQLVASLL